jgi:epoxyqueuosine reductase QueG
MTDRSRTIAESTARVVIDTLREAPGSTGYRAPLVSFAGADAPEFAALTEHIGQHHLMPSDLLPGARSVVSFFLPFADRVPAANAADRRDVAREWAVAYVETNALIAEISASVVRHLESHGFRAASEPPTGNFDRDILSSWWSHKSVAVIAGLGTFGVHRMVITGAGCAGRFGSVVTDAELPVTPAQVGERCFHLAGERCLECVKRCPVGALRADGSIDRERCWAHCQDVARGFEELGGPEVCGKCATGPCALAGAGAKGHGGA